MTAGRGGALEHCTVVAYESVCSRASGTNTPYIEVSGKYHSPGYTGYGTDDMYSRKPDASLHDPSPAYLRGLLERAGITQQAAATALGITGRVMRYY